MKTTLPAAARRKLPKAAAVEVWLCVLVDGDDVRPVDAALDPQTVQTWADAFNSIPYSGGGAHIVRATVDLAGIAKTARKAVSP